MANFFGFFELQYAGKQKTEQWIVIFSKVSFHCTYANNIKLWWNSKEQYYSW